MASRNALRGVLTNFLGTYVSRNSDYEGYWIFGFFACDAEGILIDLLLPIVPEQCSAIGEMRRLAVTKFYDQLIKAGLNLDELATAELSVRYLPDSIKGEVNGHSTVGHTVNFTVHATMKGGKQYQSSCCVFVAPHNPNHERRRV